MESIGPYGVIGLLGKGATAEVYRARHPLLLRDVAVKIFAPDAGPERRERFDREARALSAIAHPNVVRLSDFGATEDGRPYLVMEWIEGLSLARTLRLVGRFAPDKLVPLALQIAKGLQAVHLAGVVHRDLKPGNIVLSSPDELAKIVDFGLVCGPPETYPAITKPGSTVGTPPYMAPEQIRAQPVEPRTDIYSLGVILYELLSGTNPFASKIVIEALMAHLEKRPPPMAEAHGELGAMIDRMLAIDASERPDDAEVIETLDAMAGTAVRRRTIEVEPDTLDPVAIEPTPVIPRELTAGDADLRPTKTEMIPRKRQRWWIAGAALSIAAAALTLSVMISPPSPAPTIERMPLPLEEAIPIARPLPAKEARAPEEAPRKIALKKRQQRPPETKPPPPATPAARLAPPVVPEIRLEAAHKELETLIDLHASRIPTSKRTKLRARWTDLGNKILWATSKEERDDLLRSVGRLRSDVLAEAAREKQPLE